MKKILFITDSLGLPRLKPEPVPADKTWPYALAQRLSINFNGKFLFYFHCLHGLTTDAVVDHIQDVLGAYEPDMVILQIGIVDCYPRALRKKELAILTRIPILSKFTHWFVRKYYKSIISYRNICYVDINKFSENISYIYQHFKNSKIVVLPIAPPSDEFISKNPLIYENVKKYNNVIKIIFGDNYLENTFNVMNINDLYLSDNYHLSVFGNNVVTDILFYNNMNWFDNA